MRNYIQTVASHREMALPTGANDVRLIDMTKYDGATVQADFSYAKSAYFTYRPNDTPAAA
jgi:hypothetical protein